MPKIHINNVELHYEEYGTGGVPVVFVHGFLASSKMWEDVYIARLPEHYHAYALDMRGHGQSHHIKHGCHVVQLADDAYQFVQHLQLGKCIYVGFSMGGAIGIQLALDHPDVLNALILMNPGFGSPLSEGYGFIVPWIALIAQKRWILKRLLRSTFTNTPSEDVIQDFLNDAMLVSKDTWTEYVHPRNSIRHIDHLRQLEAPTLVMIGGKDSVFPLTLQHQLVETIPHAQKIVFENAGHAMFSEIPEHVFKAMNSFLEQLPYLST